MARPKPEPDIPARLTVEPWEDALIERHGHDPRSAYAETFWLPILGPSTTWLIRRLATGFDHEPAGYELHCADLSRELGLGTALSRNSSFVRALDRTIKFNMAQMHDTTLYVRRRIAPLADRQLTRLPPRLRQLHNSWVAPTLTESEFDQTVIRSRRLALTLLELGEDLSTTEQQLHAWHFHPSVAFDAAHWAVRRHQRAQEAAESQPDDAGDGHRCSARSDAA